MLSIRRTALMLMFGAVSVNAQSQKKELTEDQFVKNNFTGIIRPLPTIGNWIDDNQFIYTKEGRRYLFDCTTGTETEFAGPKTGSPGKENKPIIIVKKNNLYIRGTDEDVQLTFDEAPEINPLLSPDNSYIAYTKNNDLYTVQLQTRKETRLTFDGSDLVLNGYASWLYYEEILGRESQYRSFWWSPDSKRLAFFRADDTGVPEFVITNAKGLHGEVEHTHYPKVGDHNPEIKVGMVAPDGGKILWADFNEKDDQYFGLPYWKPDGSSLLVQWMPRNQHAIKIYDVDPATGKKKEFYSEEQKTWITLKEKMARINFLESGKGFILLSDVTGWRHMYLYGMDGKLINPITTGKYSVWAIHLVDEANKVIYFSARGRENSTRIDLYRVGFDGKKLQRLTFGDYHHSSIRISPKGNWFVTTFSNLKTPPRIAVVDNKGKIVKELADAKGPEFDNYHLAVSEMIRVKSSDSLFALPMRVTWPLNMEKGKVYPVMVNTYGGPDTSNCFDTWNFSSAQQWLAREGMIQVTMDHRGSGQFGKEGQAFLYHDLGHWEITDYSTMVKWLIANGNADPKRIGIRGESFGGYLSAMAVTKGADVFTHALVGLAVTDWSLYDSHYTERFMGLPSENPDGYRSNSVMNYVNNYKGMMQIVHGETDDNVHLQNALQFISKLQDAKKEFDMMIYPDSRHGWGGNKGAHWSNLRTKFIYKYLLNKEVPSFLIR